MEEGAFLEVSGRKVLSESFRSTWRGERLSDPGMERKWKGDWASLFALRVTQEYRQDDDSLPRRLNEYLLVNLRE